MAMSLPSRNETVLLASLYCTPYFGFKRVRVADHQLGSQGRVRRTNISRSGRAPMSDLLCLS